MKICSYVTTKLTLMILVAWLGLLLPCLSIAADQEDPRQEMALQQLLALQAQLDRINTRLLDQIFIPLSPFMADVWKDMPPKLLWEIVQDAVPHLKVLPEELDRTTELGRQIERALKR